MCDCEGGNRDHVEIIKGGEKESRIRGKRRREEKGWRNVHTLHEYQSLIQSLSESGFATKSRTLVIEVVRSSTLPRRRNSAAFWAFSFAAVTALGACISPTKSSRSCSLLCVVAPSSLTSDDNRLFSSSCISAVVFSDTSGRSVFSFGGVLLLPIVPCGREYPLG